MLQSPLLIPTRRWNFSKISVQQQDLTSTDDRQNKKKKKNLKSTSPYGFGSSIRPTKLSSPSSLSSPPSPTTSSSSSSSPSVSKVQRRAAPEKPLITADISPQQQQAETFFLIALFALLGLIVLQGLLLAAAGLLPDEWDNRLVKYIYPAFTPTVGLFITSAAGYGLYKYVTSQNN